jgi:hypothetical protein
VGVSIALSFDPVEDADLDEKLSTTFMEVTLIDLRELSVQFPRLRSILPPTPVGLSLHLICHLFHNQPRRSFDLVSLSHARFTAPESERATLFSFWFSASPRRLHLISALLSQDLSTASTASHCRFRLISALLPCRYILRRLPRSLSCSSLHSLHETGFGQTKRAESVT